MLYRTEEREVSTIFKWKKQGPAAPVSIESEGVRDKYARLCAIRSEPDEWQAAFEKGKLDFDRAVRIKGIAFIGVDIRQAIIHAGTECIDVEDDHGSLREIGELIISLGMREKTTIPFSVENVTRQVRDTHHPHVSGNQLCIDAESIKIILSLIDGTPSIAFGILLKALRMEKGQVVRGSAYSQFDEWPLKSEVRR